MQVIQRSEASTWETEGLHCGEHVNIRYACEYNYLYAA